MSDLIKKYRTIIFQFFKFGLVGLSNTIISYVSYAVLVFIGTNYLISNIFAFIISVLNSYHWNKKYVFKTNIDAKNSEIKTLLKVFVSYSFTGLVLNSLLLLIWVDQFKISEYIAPVINLVITIPINFLLNKIWAFRNKV